MTEERLRKTAMMRYHRGEKAREIYTDLGRSKQWFFKWLKRSLTGDPLWFKERSRVPKHQPTRTINEIRDLIVQIRKELTAQSSKKIGVPAIRERLIEKGFKPPSDRTISRILKQEGLVR